MEIEQPFGAHLGRISIGAAGRSDGRIGVSVVRIRRRGNGHVAAPGVQWTPLDLSSDEELAEDPAEPPDRPDATDPVAALAMIEDDESDIKSTEGAA